MRTNTVEPLSARLSWDEVHRLELLVRARATSFSRAAHDGSACALCGRPLDGDGMRVAGVVVHPGCLPA